MLNDTELDAMRSTAEQALPGTAIIQASGFTDDGGGGGSVGWTASGTVDCRLAPLNGGEREIADRISAEADSVVTLPVGTNVSTEMRLLIDGEAYNVEAVRDRSWPTTVRVEVSKES